MWLGIPWWVWIFVIPEVAIGLIWVLVVLPTVGIAQLINQRQERKRPTDTRYATSDELTVLLAPEARPSPFEHRPAEGPQADKPPGGGEHNRTLEGVAVGAGALSIVACGILAVVLVSPSTVGLAREAEIETLERRAGIPGPQGPQGVPGVRGARGPSGPGGDDLRPEIEEAVDLLTDLEFRVGQVESDLDTAETDLVDVCDATGVFCLTIP